MIEIKDFIKIKSKLKLLALAALIRLSINLSKLILQIIYIHSLKPYIASLFIVREIAFCILNLLTFFYFQADYKLAVRNYEQNKNALVEKGADALRHDLLVPCPINYLCVPESTYQHFQTNLTKIYHYIVDRQNDQRLSVLRAVCIILWTSTVIYLTIVLINIKQISI